MPKLIRRNNRMLRTGVRFVTDSAACKLRCACGGVEPCCLPTGYPGDSHKCGKSFEGLRHACMTGFRYTFSRTTTSNHSAVIISPVPSPCAPCPPQTSTTFSTTIVEQTGPAYAESTSCTVVMFIPVRVVIHSRITSNGVPPFCTGVIPSESREEYTGCISTAITCWPNDPGLPCAPTFNIPGSGNVVAEFEEEHTSAPPSPQWDSDRTDASVTRAKTNHTCSYTGDRERRAIANSRIGAPRLSLCSDVPGTGSGPVIVQDITSGTLSESTVLSFVLRMGWDVNCDGTPEPRVCERIDDQCHPAAVPYIRAEPCRGFPGPGLPAVVVIPVDNVFACGVIRENGWCYTIDPNSMRVSTFPTGAIISTQVVRGGGVTTCCECLPDTTCPKTDLTQNKPACWVNARRDEFTGQFIVSPAFVAGQCCCFPADRIRLVSYLVTREFNPDIAGQFQDFEECTSASRLPYPDAIPNIVAGVRRDYVGQIRYPLSCRYSRTDPFNDGAWEIAFVGGVNCVWNSPSGFLYDFAQPQSVVGFGQAAPCPNDSVVNPATGEYERNSEWYLRIVKHNVTATCDAFEFSGIRERVSITTGQVLDRTTVAIRWAIDLAPLVPGQVCTGGCTGLVATLPDPRLFAPPVDGAEPVPGGRRTGGCSSCGDGGA